MNTKRSVRILLVIVFLVLTIIAGKIIFDLGILPVKYLVRICEVLFIINFIAAFCLLINKKGVVKGISFFSIFYIKYSFCSCYLLWNDS